MGAYMYPIKIDREPKIVSYHKDIELENYILTFGILRKYVTEDEKFSISDMDGKTILSIQGKRLETKEETAKRVEREENYMREYERRKAGK